MTISKDAILQQIDEVLAQYRDRRSHAQYDDCSDLPYEVTTALITQMSATISRLAPKTSQYLENFELLLKRVGGTNAVSVPHLVGMLTALREAYDKGYLHTIEELVHADLFADFLEMAEYLVSENYKDPSAVVAGSVLEEHLRNLCQRNTIPIDVAGKPKKAEALNTDLASNGAYSKLDQKSVTAWLDLRNKAAHGHYNQYTKEQVELMIQGIRNFLSRVPA
jgi:hypothetical protein